MKNKTKKKYLLATAAVMVVSSVAGLTVENPVDVEAATAVKLSEKKQGDIITLGGKQYRVISQKYGGVMVQDLNTISSAFDTDNTNIFNPNDSNNIGYYLNTTYYNTLTPDAKSAIKTVNWHIGNELNESEKTVSAKVGLLTKSDWMTVGESFGGKIPAIGNNHEWLLTTPEYSYITSHIYMIGMSLGNVSYNYTTTVGIALARPILVLDSNLLVGSNNVVQTNQTPTNKTTIPAQTITNKGETKTINLASYFQDADGDNLTYTVSSNATSRVTGSVSGSTLTLTGQAKGTASITVTAKDPSGASVSQTFTTTVGNAAPTASIIPAQEMANIGQQITLNLGNYFQDVDGDSLSYTVVSSATDKVKSSISGSTLTLNSLAKGISNITVTATDGTGGVVSQTFTTTVKVPVPVNTNTIETQVLSGAGQSKQLTLSDYFEDASGPLKYTVTSSATNKVSTVLNDSTLTLTGMSKGDTNITVTAKNTVGETTSQTFTTTVKNTSPTLTTNFNKLNLRPGEVSSVIVLNGIDLDNDNLSYVVTSSNDNVAKVTVSANQLILEGLTEGSANIMVRVSDGETDSGLTASTKVFTVDVAHPSPTAPEEPIDVDNTGGLTNGSVNLGDIFDDENPGDLSFKPNVIVNEPDAEISIQNNMLMIENPKNDGLISVEVEATNVYGKTAVATLNMLIEVDNTNQNETKDGKATLKLLQGEFTLKTSDSTSFGTVKLAAAKQTVTTGFAQDFGVVDARGTQEGWNVTVSATPFTVESFDGFVGTPHQLPVGSLALNNVTGIERINHINTTDGLPTALANGLSVIDTNNALSIVDANQGEGLGEFKFNFGQDALALTVDALTAKIDTVNYPDQNTPYASTVTWNLVSGPQM